MNILKKGINQIKELNIKINVNTSAKIEVEVFCYYLELHFNGELKFKVFENSSVEALGNSSVVAWGNSSVEARENSSVLS